MKVRGCEGPVGKWMEGEGVRVGRGGGGRRVGLQVVAIRMQSKVLHLGT